jgi:hypothetical protein
MKLEELLERAASDYREMAMGLGPLIPDFPVCWLLADSLSTAAKRIREEVAAQEKLAVTGNEYSEAALAVLDRVRGPE